METLFELEFDPTIIVTYFMEIEEMDYKFCKVSNQEHDNFN